MREIAMKTMVMAASAAALLSLTACGGNADDRAAENIEEITENRADVLEDQADATGNEQLEDALERNAAAIRETGEDAADRADDNDDARVENQVRNGL
jgi:heterodisulfide reductase subunit C